MNELIKGQHSPLQTLHPTTLQLTKMLSIERANHIVDEWHPLTLLRRLLTQTIEHLYDESLLQESWYKANWQQCIHLLRRLPQEKQKKLFLSVWHLQSLRSGQYHVAEDIEQHFFTTQNPALLYVCPPFPQKRFTAILESNQPVQQLLFTQNLIVVQTQCGDVSVWDIETHRQKWTTENSVCVQAIATSAIETSIVFALDDQLQLVDLHTGSILQRITKHSICAVALSEEAVLAAADSFGHIHYWDVTTQRWLSDIESGLSNIILLHFVGQRLIITDSAGTLQCWIEDLLLWTQTLPTLHATSCLHSPDESFVCIGSYDGSVVTIDSNTGRIIEHSREYTKGIDALYIDSSGTLMRCASKSGELFQKTPHMDSTLLRTISEEHLRQNAIHPGGKRWASGYNDGRIFLRSTKEETTLVPQMSTITALGYCTKERVIYCGDVLGRVYLWTEQGDFLRSLPAFSASVQSLAILGKQLVVHLQNGETYRNRSRLPMPRIQSKFSFFESQSQSWIFLLWDGKIILFFTDGVRVERHPHNAPLTAWAIESDVLCLGFSTGDVLLYNWRKDRILDRFNLGTEISAVSLFNNSLFAVSQCGNAILWENEVRWRRQLSSRVSTAIHKNNSHVFVCTSENVHLLAEHSSLPLPIPSKASFSLRLVGERLLIAVEDQLCIVRSTLCARPEQKLE